VTTAAKTPSSHEQPINGHDAAPATLIVVPTSAQI
jgi:hypothetical protein